VVAAARGKGTRGVTIGVVVVVIAAAAIIGGALYLTRGAGTPERATAAEHSTTRDGVVVRVGNADAKRTVDVYEDFLCPACGQFEKTYGPELEQKVQNGTIKINYHMLPMLVRLSSPPGYSLNSANASLCAADAGKFASYHKSLYTDQPAEGSAGFNTDQLVDLGRDLGIKSGDKVDPAFESCVRGGTYNKQLDDGMNKLDDDPTVRAKDDNSQDKVNPQTGKGYFRGTPTVVVAGKAVNFGNRAWLDALN
jgi:protein-disulfide isomerase